MGGARVGLANAATSNGNGSRQVTRARWIRHEIEEGNTDGVSILVDAVGRSVDASIVRIEIQDLGGIGRAQRFGRDKCGVVNGSDGPLVEGRLISGRS